jgi:hypothetical protein
MRETSSEKFGFGERSREHSIRLEAGQKKTEHGDGGKLIVVMRRFGIGMRERGSRCRVVEGDRPAGRTWKRNSGEGARRCLEKSAERTT